MAEIAIPDFRLDGRTVFVSGAAGHLGRAIAAAFSEAGAQVILNGRNEARLKDFAKDLRNRRMRRLRRGRF